MKRYTIPIVKLSYVSDATSEVQTIKNGKDAAEIFRASFEPGEIEMQEYFKVAYLSRSHKVLGVHTASMGGTEQTVVDPRIIFTGALLAKASAIIICHNHPSGQLNPSSQDDGITKRIGEGGKILGIRLLDHIILTADDYYSYNDKGKIDY